MCTGGTGGVQSAPRRLTRPVPVLLAIALGGALGALARWSIEEALSFEPGGWPFATLVINIAGALMIGVLASLSRLTHGPAWLRPMVITGFLGGFTTFSAFAIESSLLLDEGRPSAALAYVGATLVGGLAAVRLGAAIVQRRGGAR